MLSIDDLGLKVLFSLHEGGSGDLVVGSYFPGWLQKLAVISTE